MSSGCWCAIHHWGKRRGNEGAQEGGPWGRGRRGGMAGLGWGKGGWVGQPLGKSGHLLGDALVGVVILIFISLVVVPRQFLPLAQQTGHTHSPWDVAHWELLLASPPQTHSASCFPLSPRSHPPRDTPRSTPSRTHTTQHFPCCFHTLPLPADCTGTQRDSIKEEDEGIVKNTQGWRVKTPVGPRNTERERDRGRLSKGEVLKTPGERGGHTQPSRRGWRLELGPQAGAHRPLAQSSGALLHPQGLHG